jgi:transposase
MAAYPALGRAVALREYLQDALASGERAQREGWLAWTERSRLTAFRDLAQTLKRHREGVLTYMDTKLTNGLMEAVNGLPQLTKRIARDFRNFHYFRLAAYLKAGGLNLQAPHPPYPLETSKNQVLANVYKLPPARHQTIFVDVVA